MQQEIRFASFNVCNLAQPGMQYYEKSEPYTKDEYDAKTRWIAHQLDLMNADVIGLQEIFSQAALKDVLAKTRHYQNAHHSGFDPHPSAERLTPSVALISRLPVVGEALEHIALPPELHNPMPGGGKIFTHFTRPVLHVRLILPTNLEMHAFVVHLKSKRPDYLPGEHEDNYRQYGIATLRSLVRRGTEALGLRHLLAEVMDGNRTPVVVMGDFNDTINATTTRIVLGAGRHGRQGFDERLFDSSTIARRQSLQRNVNYTDIHEGHYETIDHILVSEEFNPDSRFAIGSVEEVNYFNDHITLDMPEASDHGQVMARIRLLVGG